MMAKTDNISPFLKKFFTAGGIAKAAAAIITLAVVVGGIIKTHDEKVRREAIEKKNEDDRIHRQDSINRLVLANLRDIQVKQDTMIFQFRRFQGTTLQMSNRLKALDRSHSTLLKDLGKINLLYDFMQDQQKKSDFGTLSDSTRASTILDTINFKY
jgi:hypothetical protein